MIEIVAQDNFDPNEWRELIVEMGGNVFHLPDIWLADNKHSNMQYLIFEDGGTIVGACVALRLTTSRFRIFRSTISLYLPTMPVFSENRVRVEDLCESLVRFATSEGFKTLKVDARSGLDLSHNTKLIPFIDGHFIEFTVDLRNDIETIMKSFHKKHRKNIRKANESRLELVSDNSLAGLMELKKLQEASSARASGKGNPYGLPGETYYVEAHRHVYQNGLGNVLFAKKDKKYIAGLAYLFFGDEAVTVRSGATTEGYSVSAPYLLQYELIRRLKEDGYVRVNIGGVPQAACESSHSQHGLYQFKKGFGGTSHLRTGLKANLR